MSTGIVYYSWHGNARFVARELAGRLGAEAVELQERRRRRGIVGFISGGYLASRGRPSRLAGDPWTATASFDPIYLVTPIWASASTPAVTAYLEGAKLGGRTVHLVTVQADPNGSGHDRAIEQVRRQVEAAGGSFGDDWAITSTRPGAFAGEESLGPQVERVAPAN